MTLAIPLPTTVGSVVCCWIALILVVLVVVAVITLLKISAWRVRKDRSDKERQEELFQPNGTPYPPAAQGLCHHCRKPFDKVYFLPDGEQLCPACYRARRQPPETGQSPRPEE